MSEVDVKETVDNEEVEQAPAEELVDMILAGELHAANQKFNSIVEAKVIEKIEEEKHKISQTLFAEDDEEEEEGDDDDKKKKDKDEEEVDEAKAKVKEDDEVDIFLSHFDHDKKRIHYKLEMYDKGKNILSATTEVLSLYIDLNLRKVSEFEKEKSLIMNEFIEKNKEGFKSENLHFSNKLKNN